MKITRIIRANQIDRGSSIPRNNYFKMKILMMMYMMNVQPPQSEEDFPSSLVLRGSFCYTSLTLRHSFNSVCIDLKQAWMAVQCLS
ncbi:unnamed protein product [Moneuplotes crassus]|uniref:Uncharacterized protein n=1 Tax=Euplotes crassus TaxID=5936 RepID=A0AAD1UHW6_EUPCR|nr:unnamed protein product [Moneuplotes crassus]